MTISKWLFKFNNKYYYNTFRAKKYDKLKEAIVPLALLATPIQLTQKSKQWPTLLAARYSCFFFYLVIHYNFYNIIQRNYLWIKKFTNKTFPSRFLPFELHTSFNYAIKVMKIYLLHFSANHDCGLWLSLFYIMIYRKNKSILN